MQFQAEQQQRGQLRQGANIVQPDRQGGAGHAHPDTTTRTPVHRDAVPAGAWHIVGARVSGDVCCRGLVPGHVRGTVVLLLQRRGEPERRLAGVAVTYVFIDRLSCRCSPR